MTTTMVSNPPIRSKNDQEAFWKGLTEGVIDFVATDHAPLELLRKTGSFEQAYFGTLGLETTLRVLIEAWRIGKISSQRLVQIFSKNPANFLNLKNRLGEFKLGSKFHCVLVDLLAEPSIFTEQGISSLSKNSCFIGQKLPAKICIAFHSEQIFEFNLIELFRGYHHFQKKSDSVCFHFDGLASRFFTASLGTRKETHAPVPVLDSLISILPL